MTGRHTQEQLLAQGAIVSPPAERACRDQSFELPTGIYIAMASMFAGFVAILALAFRGQMALSYAVIFAFISVFFAVPSLLARAGPQERRTKALSWLDFSDKGIVTANGLASAKDATILILLLPFLILCFGIAVAVIAAVT